jgi:hypothetical protein
MGQSRCRAGDCDDDNDLRALFGRFWLEFRSVPIYVAWENVNYFFGLKSVYYGWP